MPGGCRNEAGGVQVDVPIKEVKVIMKSSRIKMGISMDIDATSSCMKVGRSKVNT